MGGIGLGTKKQGNTTPIGQTGLQYGSHDKRQDSNATFVNTEVTEAGKKLNLEEMGINTDINKAQVVIKDEVVEQIDTVLHTDLLNETTRNQVIRDINGLIQTPDDIVKAISETNKNGGNVLDNLVGTIRNTDGNLIKYQEMDKKYKDLKNLPDDKKAEKALELANEMARKLKENNGIDKKVEIKISFADESKGEELGAFVREDGKIEIYINPSKVDVSDMEQVYNALGAEMNHYNPSNPYVYDKTEAEAGKGNALEELFTSIGRKPLNGEGNEFYENILSGSSVLNSGNKDYSEIPEELLDFCSHPLQCPNYKFDHNKKQSVKVEEKSPSMTIGAGLTLEQIANNMANYINKNSKDDKNKNTGTGKSNTGSSKNKGTGKVPQNKNNETEYITSKDFDKVKNLEQFKEFNSYYGVPDNVEIIFKTETGEIIKFNSFNDFQAWGSEQEKLEHKKYEKLGNEALEKSKVAKTKEEKKKYEAQFEYYYSLIHEKMQKVQDRQSLGGKYTTGNYLTKSAVSYNGKTLVVSAEKYAGEIGAEHIGIFFEGVGKIGTEIWSNQKIKAESNLSQKYNNPTESIIKSRPGFSRVESDIINESEKILSSPEFEKIKIAHKEGKSVTVIIDGRTIQYEPNLPSSGMTMFGEDGFLIGREAFSSKEESAKTVLLELYRLKNSSSSLGVTGELATQETKATFDFANRAIEELIKK